MKKGENVEAQTLDILMKVFDELISTVESRPSLGAVFGWLGQFRDLDLIAMEKEAIHQAAGALRVAVEIRQHKRRQHE